MNMAIPSSQDHPCFSSEQEFRPVNGKLSSAGERERIQADSYARLRSLDEETQERIAKKYYSGTRPWETPEKKHRKMDEKRSNG